MLYGAVKAARMLEAFKGNLYLWIVVGDCVAVTGRRPQTGSGKIER